VLFAALSMACAATIFAPAGHYTKTILTGGPGLVLSGAGLSGMPHAPVFSWLRAHFNARPKARAGNVVILKASGARDYSDDFYREGRFASVQEILIPPCAPRSQIDRAVPYAERADVILFAGGDQANYVRWKGSKLIASVKRLYARGGLEGGGSAGLAIQGAVVYDSVAADRVLPDDEEVHSADAVRNPMERAISFTTNFFAWPALGNAITDSHFAVRDRFGRLAAFMARALQERLVKGDRIYGVGVDEDAVLLVDRNGIATLYQRAREQDGYFPKGAWILTGRRPQRLAPGVPLQYTVEVTHLRRNGERYSLISKRGDGRTYVVRIDGSAAAVYSRLPY
jgi:cyanophycinase-like exopeptidase